MAHLIHPVAAGPVLTESELKQLSPGQVVAIKRMLQTGQEIDDETLASIDRVIDHSKLMQIKMQDLEKLVEEHEESKIDEGHHPVNKISIRDDE